MFPTSIKTTIRAHGSSSRQTPIMATTATFILHLPLPLFLLLLLLHLTHSQPTNPPATQYAERQILLRLQSRWNNPPSLSSWTESSTASHCSWLGVTCSNASTVSNITLRDKGVDGDVPPFICDLSDLSVLDLFNNSVSGEFPAFLSSCANLVHLDLAQNLLVGLIPSDMGTRLPSKIQYLSLAANNLSGDIPVSISKLVFLRELHLDNNFFSGPFPAVVTKLLNLEKLTLATNPFFSSSIPAEIGSLTKLRYLWMAEANLTGPIPETFAKLEVLEHLDLSMNRLNGAIPAVIWALKNLRIVYLFKNNLVGGILDPIGSMGLEEIDISINQLNGTIPEDFGKLRNLTILYLYNNNFSGEIPAGIGKLPRLYDIKLFRNILTGAIPPELGKNSNLWNCELSQNQLIGELPEGLCNAGYLNSLVVFENKLSGTIPASIGNCSTLLSLMINKNSFSGSIPSTIWALPGLMELLMKDNAFSGEIPTTMPPKLARLELNNNGFTGKIPLAAASLQVFRGSNNAFSGGLPADMSGLSALQELLLDGNRISGNIPASIGKLSKLSFLNLSSNQLTGEIPEDIGSMPVLTALDLSNNHLSGVIPAKLGTLKLNSFNVSSNSFTGEVPLELQNEAYDRSFLSNPGLCSSKTGLNLPSCTARGSHSGELPKGLLALILLLGIILLLAAVVYGFATVRDIRRQRLGGAYDLSKWKLTSFQSLDFTEASIVRGLTADNLIGSGGSGQVYRIPIGRHRDGEVVAVKKIWNSKKLDSKLLREFQAEVEILGSIKHINIVKLLCCISSTESKLLVYEYMENGCLHQWLHGRKMRTFLAGKSLESSRRRGGLDWPTRLGIAVGAAKGLCYMHHDCSPPIVHRDIKSSNILLDSDFKAKVADFGLAKILVNHGEPETVSTVAGSFGYMAPESGYTKKVDEKIDVYSFGVVLLELLTGRMANDGGEDKSLAEWAWRHFQEGGSVMDVVDGEIREPPYLDEMSKVMRLGLVCTGTLPSSRPTMKDVLQVLLRCYTAHDLDDKGSFEYDDVKPLARKASRRNKNEDDDKNTLMLDV